MTDGVTEGVYEGNTVDAIAAIRSRPKCFEQSYICFVRSLLSIYIFINYIFVFWWYLFIFHFCGLDRMPCDMILEGLTMIPEDYSSPVAFMLLSLSLPPSLCLQLVPPLRLLLSYSPCTTPSQKVFLQCVLSV